MAILTDLGPILSFEETMILQQIIKKLGIQQFLHLLGKYGTWQKPLGVQQIKWGEEIQGHFLEKNENGQLQLCKKDISSQYHDLNFPLMLQYGSWMFEMIPNHPYSTQCNFNEIIDSIRYKYQVLNKKSRLAFTIPVIPFLGLRSNKKQSFNNQITNSCYIDDDHISDHPRFKTLTKHIRLRRGENVQIFVPLFIDQKTDFEEIAQTQPKQGFVYLDAMAFGMGSSCLQCTFSTKSLSHARYIYDQMNVISPLFLALTAGTAIYKGKLVDWDVRWNIISGSCDDRTSNERDINHQDYIPSSRYGFANYYLSNSNSNLSEYNDFYTGARQIDIKNVKLIAEQQKIQIDNQLAFHIANIFRRDFLIIYQKFKAMKSSDSIIFDMINSTNWNSVRLKIPIDDEIGWRVEFRTMQVQLTADENSAYSLLIHLIARILHENTNLNFYIPISKLKQNFDRAHIRDAARTQKFYFRTNIYDQGTAVIEELTLHEIMFGKNQFAGLFIEIQNRFKGCVKMCEKVNQLVNAIKKFIFNTTSGKRLTLAQWTRRFVQQHNQYQHNSIVSKKVMDDLLLTLHAISSGKIKDDNFPLIFDLKYSQTNKDFLHNQCYFHKQKNIIATEE